MLYFGKKPTWKSVEEEIAKKDKLASEIISDMKKKNRAMKAALVCIFVLVIIKIIMKLVREK